MIIMQKKISSFLGLRTIDWSESEDLKLRRLYLLFWPIKKNFFFSFIDYVFTKKYEKNDVSKNLNAVFTIKMLRLVIYNDSFDQKDVVRYSSSIQSIQRKYKLIIFPNSRSIRHEWCKHFNFSKGNNDNTKNMTV